MRWKSSAISLKGYVKVANGKDGLITLQSTVLPVYVELYFHCYYFSLVYKVHTPFAIDMGEIHPRMTDNILSSTMVVHYAQAIYQQAISNRKWIGVNNEATAYRLRRIKQKILAKLNAQPRMPNTKSHLDLYLTA